MKLRNKKTGEIIEVDMSCRGGRFIGDNSLAELNEEWEDYEEPKKFWEIDRYSRVQESKEPTDSIINPYWKKRLEIGNYFETKEEAEKAVEKLKAWKRLKDKGFKFEGLTYSTWDNPCVEYTVEGEYLNSDVQVEKDLNLLFGGEDEL